MDPRGLLDAAEDALRHTGSLPPGVRPRAGAFLGRQAIEEGLERLWAGRAPGVARCSMRAQLACLPRYVRPDVAQQTAYAWSALSRACHHDPYDLVPTVAEIRDWLAMVREGLAEIDRVLRATAAPT